MDRSTTEDIVTTRAGDGTAARLRALGWAAGWAAALAFATWMLRLTPGWLAASAAGAAAWALLARDAGRGWRMAGAAGFAAALSIGAATQVRLHRVATDWTAVRDTAENVAAAELDRRLSQLAGRAHAALGEAAAVTGRQERATAALFDRLAAVRRDAGMTALVVYEADGTPFLWAGEHRGEVPDSVRLGLREYSFSAGPLFGYVYFARHFADGRTAVAALLLESHVRVGEGSRPFSERFAESHGMTPRFVPPALAQGRAVWDWRYGGPVLSVEFAAVTQEVWRARVAEGGRRWAGLALAATLLLLTAGWFRARPGRPGVPVVAGTAVLLALPLGEMVGAEGVFSPLRFVLPVPGDVTLGQLLLFLSGVAVWLLTRSRPARMTARLPLAARAVLAAGGLAGALALVRASVAEGVLAETAAGGLALVTATALLAALPMLALLGPSPRTMGARERAEVLAVAYVGAGLLAAGLLVWWRPGRELPVWSAAAWALPFALAAAVLPRSQAGRGALLPWVTAGWIAGTMALSSLWVLHQEARVREAERELGRLGTAADPFLDFLLRQFAEKVLFYASEGREGVSLLYQSWVEGGLAEEGYEARLTLWDGDAPVEELRLAETQLPAEMVPRMLAAARAAEEPLLERHTDLDSIHYLLAVPLPGGRTVSVAVPPRRHIGRSTALARFLDPSARDDEGTADLSLVAPPPGEADAPPPGRMAWVGAENGWRSEAVVRFPGGPMHAHLLVRTPSTAMLLVRGLLSLIGVLLLLAVAWAAARTLCGEPLGLPSGRRAWLATFRGRLTLALFGFFLVPMLAFAATAYRALSREVVRTAGAVAQRALAQGEADIGMGSLEDLGRRVGAELLLYHQGVLVEGSTPEVIDLGLYHAWLTPEAYLGFLRAEDDERQEEVRRLAGSRYLVAYRRLGPVDVLAAPTPLATGEIARRQRELASVVLLAALAGGALSVVLSLLVGRALSRPIDVLSQAAADVGRGNLAVRLPARRRDEFGGLYRSFNQMVRGLRHARGALERETRRTEAIVAEAGTGVVALDGAGRVALINPRACQILGAEVAPGSRIPGDQPLPAAVAAAVQRFLASGAREWAEEREVDARVVRLRLRRLVAEGGRGAVLVLEDVTAEMRSARVLAWGEMARQVAHEIKNPLTPIKLAVQHIRRAHADRRDNFGTILDRNVDAVLQEIDRLGEIARAFARFGAPGDPGEPAVPADVGGVAHETLALYRGGQDGIAYRVEVEPGTPRAFTRVGELKEVLVNLLENARAALPEGGEVRIGAGPAGGGAWVRLDVTDTGEGIPVESLPRIFEPQFSTRSSGTGLGLAIVKRLVESWGGEVTVDSEPGAGTTVHLRLRAEEAPAAPSLDGGADGPADATFSIPAEEETPAAE